MNDLFDKLTEVFRVTFEDATIELTPETTADDIEAWDSLSHVNLIMAVEIKFGIEFTMKETMSFANVGELAACIERKLAAKSNK